MGNIWIVSENPEVAAQLLTAAADLGGDAINMVLIGEKDAVKPAASGANRIYAILPEDGRPESAIPAIVELIKKEGADAILFGATPRGCGIAASVAGKLDLGMASEACGIKKTDKGFIASRYVYGGSGISELAFPGAVCATILPNTFTAPESAARKAEIVEMTVPGDNRVKVVSCDKVERNGEDLAAADRVVCVGRGVAKEDDLAIARDLCAALGASLGCSRGIAEDLKWLPLDSYIGISGVKLNGDLYLSIGVSGQVQHVSGIRDVKVIVAVDNNENAPIFRTADYGIVGDLYEVGPAICKALGA